MVALKPCFPYRSRPRAFLPTAAVVPRFVELNRSPVLGLFGLGKMCGRIIHIA